MHRVWATVPAAAAALLVAATAAQAQPSAPVPAPQNFEVYCQPTDPGLAELSGMAFADGALYAIGDSGTDENMAELDANCAVQRWIPVPVDPYDIEDMDARDGTIWLSDTGDNRRQRDTVALIGVDPTAGTGALHRLTYPDGPHDAEALIIEPDGRPVIITKEFAGTSGVYVPDSDTPAAELPSPGPAALRRVGALHSGPATAGGAPVPGELVTGAALSADGSVAAVRSYGRVYLFPVSDGDVAAAITTQAPVVIPAPIQPQGETVEFTESGDLLIGSESGGELRPLPPIMVLRGATELVAPVVDTDTGTAESPADAAGSNAAWWAGGAVIAGLAVVAGAVVVWRRR
ncbi:hypothetical protein OG921_22400 [Aldersonia sp. NBC_00410]|uniref:hypothetical protein n=1 Tax=Aldersonia sp. NBC_00410 TaxID=2975954 RepID=UPI00224E5B1F|nr:hypothetical protein [Aldersonia sp. NBC_00410]MCX5045924.1 hypothetical protein [Aldersonia sp. NBC_00410]